MKISSRIHADCEDSKFAGEIQIPGLFKDEQKPALLRATKSMKESKRIRFWVSYHTCHDICFPVLSTLLSQGFIRLAGQSHRW